MKHTLLATIALLSALCLQAAKPVEEVTDPFELDIQENISLPVIGKRQHQAVVQRMQSVQADLQRHKLNATRTRQGEVVVVSVPCSELFAPNDTTAITDKGRKLLHPLIEYAQRPGNYKIIIAVHTDDTGSADYRDALSEARAGLISDLFEAEAPEAEKAGTIIAYGMGDESLLVPNDSILNRAKNRRAEIFIVPLK